MGMPPARFWLMSTGLFLDMWTIYKQWHGIEKAKTHANIDQIIPFGI